MWHRRTQLVASGRQRHGIGPPVAIAPLRTSSTSLGLRISPAVGPPSGAAARRGRGTSPPQAPYRPQLRWGRRPTFPAAVRPAGAPARRLPAGTVLRGRCLVLQLGEAVRPGLRLKRKGIGGPGARRHRRRPPP